MTTLTTWLLIGAAALVAIVVLRWVVAKAVRGLRQFIRNLWPHS
jgi:hypothetical protein